MSTTAANPINNVAPTRQLTFHFFAITFLLATPSDLAQIQGNDPATIRQWLLDAGVAPSNIDECLAFITLLRGDNLVRSSLSGTASILSSNITGVYGQPPCPKKEDAQKIMGLLAKQDSLT